MRPLHMRSARLVALLFLVVAGILAPGLVATELDCESGDNSEGGCCCFLKAHTYTFDPVPVSRLEVTFDTGRGLDCRSQVAIQVLRSSGWQTLRTVQAVSSAGRSQTNRLSGGFDVDGTLSGVRVDDGGRCYIDYSKISFGEAGGSAPPASPPTPPADGLASGTYQVDSYADRAYRSTWMLERSGETIRGTSEWDCCPGRRTDPLQGRVRGDQVRIARDCSGQGASGRCVQVYDGRISGDRIAGTWTHNDRFVGRWWLDLNDLGQPEPAGPRIVARPSPPYAWPPVTIDFALEGSPVPGAEWWMDDRRMTNADIFFWTFAAAGTHQVELRDARGGIVSRHELQIASAAGSSPPPAAPRGLQIVPDPPPPYGVSAAVVFRQEPRPIAGARWYVDGRRVSDQETLTYRFRDEKTYEIALKAAGGAVLAIHEVRVAEGAGAAYTLWGRQGRDQGPEGGIRNDTRELALERSATVTEVEGSASRYCIWAVDEFGAFDRQVVCGREDEPILGAILLPGRYVVLPALAAGQRSSEVTVHLRARRIRASQ